MLFALDRYNAHIFQLFDRDLKCENILLDGHNNIKVSDFGFARILKPDDVSRTFCGSAAYAAPEILQGIPYSGFAYDVWSIGVILYIMVCTRNSDFWFTGCHVYEVLSFHNVEGYFMFVDVL